MIQVAVDWLRSVVLVSFLATLVRNLTPNTALRPYVRLVMGFVVLSVLLQPLVVLVARPASWPDLKWYEQDGQGKSQTEALIETGNSVTQRGTEAAVRQIERQLSEQIEAVLLLLPEVQKARVIWVDLDQGKLGRIEIAVAGDGDDLERRVRDFLSGFLGIAPSALTIQRMEEGEAVWTPGSSG